AGPRPALTYGAAPRIGRLQRAGRLRRGRDIRPVAARRDDAPPTRALRGAQEMSVTFRAQVKRTLLATGHYRRHLAAARFPGVVVLCYHAVRPDSAPPEAYPFEQLHVRASELAAHCEL